MMKESKMLSTRIEKEYDYIHNEWERHVYFTLHDGALFSGLLADISPMQLHTLVTLSLFMKDNGKIDISLADLAKALGISFHQAQKRVEDVLAFRFRDKPILHVNQSKLMNDENEAIRFQVLPISPITFVDEHNKDLDSVSSKDSDYLFEYLRQMIGAPQISQAECELICKVQEYPYELAPQVIELLIEHVIEHKHFFDQSYFKMVAHSWSESLIQSREQALKWIQEKSRIVAHDGDLPPGAYLLQYLRERLRREPSGTQVNVIFQLFEPPYEWDSGCIEVLIDHVVSQMLLQKGKTDFPKRYVEVIANEWLEKGIRSRDAALQAVGEWTQKNQLQTTAPTERVTRPVTSSQSGSKGRVKSEYLEKLRKAGL